MASIADKTVLITGANRGIGQSLVEEALRRGAKRVYAATRRPLTHSDGRVTESIAENWRSGAAKVLERQFAAFVAAEPIQP